MGTNVFEFLKNYNEKFVWCINFDSKTNNINKDTPNQEIQEIILFTCACKDILKNKEAQKILNNVKVVNFEEEGNDLFVFADCNNFYSIKSQLNSQGIF